MTDLANIVAANRRDAKRQRKAGVPALLKALDFSYDEKGHSEPWRNAVAFDLNSLLGRAHFFMETSADESDIEAALVTLRIVKRVENFEEIQRKKITKPKTKPKAK